MDLSKEALEQTIIDIAKYTKDRGKILAIEPTHVTYPLAETWTDVELTEKEYIRISAHRAKALAVSMGELRTRFKESPSNYERKIRITQVVYTEKEAIEWVKLLREILTELEKLVKLTYTCRPGWEDWDGRYNVVCSFWI